MKRARCLPGSEKRKAPAVMSGPFLRCAAFEQEKLWLRMKADVHLLN